MGRCDLGTSEQPHELSPLPRGSQSPEPLGLLEGAAGASQPAWGPAGVLGTVSRVGHGVSRPENNPRHQQGCRAEGPLRLT